MVARRRSAKADGLHRASAELLQLRICGEHMTASPVLRDRTTVCVQGLGFVGTAMAIATASALDPSGKPCFEVTGVDLPTPAGQAAVTAINTGKLQLVSGDPNLQQALQECRARGNLAATTDETVYERADIVLVDIHLDVNFNPDGIPHVDFSGLRLAIRSLGQRLKPGALIIVETTVPPGTCERVVVPELAAALRTRGLPVDALLVAHSYERVMPGRDYLSSITNFWRVYSGTTEAAADACESFLSRVINTRDFPLTRLHSTTASETAKVLENSYRATNIAFIHEWGRFAESAGVDMFAVLDAIRVRPTHNNIRQPGFGVGGYCLTKDPAFVMVAATQLLNLPELDFPFCKAAMSTNATMPLHSLQLLRLALGGDLRDKRIMLLGVTYRQDVGDTRYSAAETFVRAAEEAGAHVEAHDPMLSHWPELDRSLPATLPDPRAADGVVFAVPHRAYADLDVVSWLHGSRPVILDADHVLTAQQVTALRSAGHKLHFVGRGD
jgi:UDP-N-acetyl-D-glucosamine dehydrogenase